MVDLIKDILEILHKADDRELRMIYQFVKSLVD